MKNQYTAFAPVYDRMMHDVDRNAWIDYLDGFLRDNGAHRIMDCACGTGAAAILLYKKGYHVTGNDVSPEMLIEARNNAFREGAKGWLPVSRLCVDLVSRLKTRTSYFPANCLKAVARSVTPTFFVHGDEDEVVPYRMMDELYRACSAQKEALTVHGAKHGEAFAVDPDGYRARILPFLERYCSDGKQI